MTNNELNDIINEVEDQHPYKQRGNPDSYSKYNEGWADACDVIRTKFELNETVENDNGPCIECKYSYSWKNYMGWFCRLKNSPIKVGVDTCDKFERLFEQQKDEPPETEDTGN